MDFNVIAYQLLVQCFMVIVGFLMFVVSAKQNNYFRVGPSKNLTIINIDINNETLYFTSIAFISLLRFFFISHKRLSLNYINNNIFNLKNKDKYVNNFSILINLIQSVTQMILLKIFVTQMDYAIFTIIISELLFVPFNIYHTTKYTHHRPAANHVLDVTTINPLF